MSGILEDGGDLGVGHEVRPALLVPVQDRPDAVVVAGILEHHRTFGPVVLALVSALRPEHFQELLDVVDGRRGQNHDNAPSLGAPAGRLAQGQFSGSAAPAESVDLPICPPSRRRAQPATAPSTTLLVTAHRVAAARPVTPILV